MDIYTNDMNLNLGHGTSLSVFNDLNNKAYYTDIITLSSVIYSNNINVINYELNNNLYNSTLSNLIYNNNNTYNNYAINNNLYTSTLSNLIYVNNNNINAYQTTNNFYRSTLSGNVKYISNFITSLSGNLNANYLLKLDAKKNINL